MIFDASVCVKKTKKNMPSAVRFISAVPAGLQVASASPSSDAFVGTIIESGTALLPFGGPVAGWLLNGLAEEIGLVSSPVNPFAAVIEQLNVITSLLINLTNAVSTLQTQLTRIAQNAAGDAFANSASTADQLKNRLIVQYNNFKGIGNQYARAVATGDATQNQATLLNIQNKVIVAANNITNLTIDNYPSTLLSYNDTIAPSDHLGTIAFYRNYLYTTLPSESYAYDNMVINAMWQIYWKYANIQIQGLQTLIEAYHTPATLGTTTPRDLDAAIALTKTYYDPALAPIPNGILNQQRTQLLPPTPGQIFDRVVITGDIYNPLTGTRINGILSPGCRMWASVSPINPNSGFTNRSSAMWWPRSSVNGNFAAAIAQLNTIRYAGFTDWRLPTPEEVWDSNNPTVGLLSGRLQLAKPQAAGNYLTSANFQDYFSIQGYWMFALTPDGGGNPRIYFIFPTSEPASINGVVLTINVDASSTPTESGTIQLFKVDSTNHSQFSGPVAVYGVRTPTVPTYPST